MSAVHDKQPLASSGSDSPTSVRAAGSPAALSPAGVRHGVSAAGEGRSEANCGPQCKLQTKMRCVGCRSGMSRSLLPTYRWIGRYGNPWVRPEIVPVSRSCDLDSPRPSFLPLACSTKVSSSLGGQDYHPTMATKLRKWRREKA